jgi:hypothetical protein
MQPYYVAAKFLRRKLPYIFLLLGNARRGVCSLRAACSTAQAGQDDALPRLPSGHLRHVQQATLHASSSFFRLPKDLDI